MHRLTHFTISLSTLHCRTSHGKPLAVLSFSWPDPGFWPPQWAAAAARLAWAPDGLALTHPTGDVCFLMAPGSTARTAFERLLDAGAAVALYTVDGQGAARGGVCFAQQPREAGAVRFGAPAALDTARRR